MSLSPPGLAIKSLAGFLILFFYLFFHSQALMADSVQPADRPGNSFTTGNHSDGASIAIPPVFLKQSEAGELLLDHGGDQGESPDDFFRKKPRPYFAPDSLWLSDSLWLPDPASLEKKISDLLDYIESLLDRPEWELARSQLVSSLNELETLNNERRKRQAQEQQAAEALIVELPAENGWHFTNHPGYQAEHPAHPHGTTGNVPGILEVPIAGKKSDGGGSSSRNSHKTPPLSSGSGPDRGSGSGGGEGAASGSGGDGGGNNRRPDQKKLKTEGSDKKINAFLSKEIKVDGQTYTITTPKTEDVSDLECSICLSLVSKIAHQCQECGNNICKDDFEQLQQNFQTPTCPSCREINNFQQINMQLRINRLLWDCPKGCGLKHDLSGIESHIRSCNEGTYFCNFERCQYSGLYQDVVIHETVCIWRPVNLGAARFFAWQAGLVNQYQADVRGDEAPGSIEDEPGYIITILRQALETTQNPEANDVASFLDCAFSCGFQCTVNNDLEQHYLNDCPNVSVHCESCQKQVSRTRLQEHKDHSCPDRIVSCPNPCNTNMPFKDLAQHLPSCKWCSCKYCGISTPELDEHTKECPLNLVDCFACHITVSFAELKSHHDTCPEMHVDMGKKRLTRQSADSGDVYEADGDVYIRLSTTAKISTNTQIRFQGGVYKVTILTNSVGNLLFMAESETPTSACVDVISQEGIILGYLKRYFLQDPDLLLGARGNAATSWMAEEEINPILQQARLSGSCLFLKVKPSQAGPLK